MDEKLEMFEKALLWKCQKTIAESSLKDMLKQATWVFGLDFSEDGSVSRKWLEPELVVVLEGAKTTRNADGTLSYPNYALMEKLPDSDWPMKIPLRASHYPQCVLKRLSKKRFLQKVATLDEAAESGAVSREEIFKTVWDVAASGCLWFWGFDGVDWSEASPEKLVLEWTAAGRS